MPDCATGAKTISPTSVHLLEIGHTVRDSRLPAKDLEALGGRNDVAVDQRFVVEQRVHRVRNRRL